MNSQNSLSHIILAYKKTSFAFIFFISFTLLSFKTQNVEALFIPTLSASVDQSAVSVNGNQVINSTGKTTEIPLSLTVNTNNKTGYTATLNSETNETALVNNNSTNGAKINSVSTNLSLNNLPNNSWGYKFGSSTNYAPIPALSTPAQILQTTEKTNGNESNQLSIGMKLSDNLESGRYTNKLIFSILTNNYNRIAIMTEGPDFNTKLKALETATNKIEHFKKSTVAPTASMNAINIEDEESDYEIKLWLDSTDKTAYYYAETEKVYLNANTSDMFNRMTNLATLDLSNFDTSKVTNMRFMFSDMPNLTTLNLSNFDTSNVTNMGAMFRGVSNLTTLNLSNFDTSNVTNMGSMFFHASNLTTLNLSNFDTSKVMYMNSMFSDMYNLTALNLSSFDTSNVIDMAYMFSDMSNLTNLNLSNFDTSKVTDMSGMFSGMSNLTTIDLSNFNTSQVTAMNHMFYDMSNLITLNLSNFDTSKVTNLSFMFYLPDENKSKDKLEKIYVNNDFDTTKLTNFSAMFMNRKKLRGGNGSYLADPYYADKTWLRIDRPGAPGYFTRKP
mgnify:CR=1 FL=1